MKTAKSCKLMPNWHVDGNGDPGRTRTPNILIRSQVLYPVELRDRSSKQFYCPRKRYARSGGHHQEGACVILSRTIQAEWYDRHNV